MKKTDLKAQFETERVSITNEFLVLLSEFEFASKRDAIEQTLVSAANVGDAYDRVFNFEKQNFGMIDYSVVLQRETFKQKA